MLDLSQILTDIYQINTAYVHQNQLYKPQHALISLMHCMGALQPENIKTSISSMDIDSSNQQQIISHITNICQSAEMDTLNPKPEVILQHYAEPFENTHEIISSLVCITQKGMYRSRNKLERHEIKDDTQIQTHKDKILKSLAALAFHNEIPIHPSYRKDKGYKIAILPGASYGSFLRRVNYMQKRLSSKDFDMAIVLSGNRELYMPIDSIEPNPHNEILIKDLTYMQYLIDEYDVHVDKNNCFIVYTDTEMEKYQHIDGLQVNTTENMPPGRYKNRIYINYNPQSKHKPYENILNEHIFKNAFPYLKANKQYIVTNNQEELSKGRPTTESTIQDAMQTIHKIQTQNNIQNISFLTISNQPYIKRQSAIIQRVILDYYQQHKPPNPCKLKFYQAGPATLMDKQPNLQTTINEIASYILEKTALYNLMHKQKSTE